MLGLSIGAIICALAAVLLMWTAWRRRTDRRAPLIASLVAWAVAVTLWIVAFGAEVGIPLALESAAIVAFLFILSRIELRTTRSARDRSIPASVRPRGRTLRGTARAIGAGPLGLAAAIGIGVLFATAAPLDDATRLILAGLLVPSLWAMAMIWVLASRRAVVPAAGLLGIAVATIGLSMVAGR